MCKAIIRCTRVFRSSFTITFKYNLISYGNLWNFFLFSLLKPFFGVLAFIFMATFVSNSESTTSMSLTSYIVIGSLLLIFVHKVLWGLSSELNKERKLGTLVGIFVTPASRTFWLAGKTVSFLLGGFMELSILGPLWAIMGVRSVGMTNFFFVAISFALMLYCFMGFGYIVTCLDFLSRNASWLSNLIQPAIIALCGIYYAPTAEIMPRVLYYISSIVLAPITISIETTREAILGSSSLDILIRSWYTMFVLGSLLFIIGQILFSLIERLLKKHAILEYY